MFVLCQCTLIHLVYHILLTFFHFILFQFLVFYFIRRQHLIIPNNSNGTWVRFRTLILQKVRTYIIFHCSEEREMEIEMKLQNELNAVGWDERERRGRGRGKGVSYLHLHLSRCHIGISNIVSCVTSHRITSVILEEPTPSTQFIT